MPSKSKTKPKPGFKRRISYIFSRSSVAPITSGVKDELSKFSRTTLKKKPTQYKSPGFFRNLMSRFTRRRDAPIEPTMTMTSNPLNKSKGGRKSRKSRKFRYD